MSKALINSNISHNEFEKNTESKNPRVAKTKN